LYFFTYCLIDHQQNNQPQLGITNDFHSFQHVLWSRRDMIMIKKSLVMIDKQLWLNQKKNDIIFFNGIFKMSGGWVNVIYYSKNQHKMYFLLFRFLRSTIDFYFLFHCLRENFIFSYWNSPRLLKKTQTYPVSIM
jgi:hypothetical protein